MARHQFRLFSNLSFLQSIDKERSLGRLLASHRDYFACQGLDVDLLTNGDACARQLLAVFTKADQSMPGDLLHDLYLIDEVGDEDGHQRILEEAERLGIDLGALPDDVAPGDFALRVFLDHPDLIRACHEKTVVKQAKRYYEYRSGDRRRFTVSDLKAAVSKVRDNLAPWFEARKRTRTCELFVYPEGDAVRILVTHGGLFRADGNITADLEFSRLPWRPQRHDSVVYETRTGILKVHAAYGPQRKVYREAFGTALADDAAFFLDAPTYSLEALRANGGMLTLVDGINDAAVVEVLVEPEAADCRQALFRGDDLTEMIAGHGGIVLPLGEITYARFLLTYAGSSRPLKMEVRLPNVTDYDRERNGATTEAFIRANALLADAEVDDRELVDAY